jgi:UDP-N-acetylglucosamine 1-carboxyvinyltransferase
MDKLVIRGGTALSGEIRISGAKNAALPILISTLTAPGSHHLQNVPDLADINSTLSLLGRIGCPSLKSEPVEGQYGQDIHVDTSRIAFSEAPYDVVRKMRASVLVLGPLLARKGHARVSMPGGCAIGVRPIDQHLKGLEALGCRFELVGGYIEGRVDHLKGAEIDLSVPTVTGTENILMAAVLADGITTINNAAREPEVVDLVRHLQGMGARIKGEGTSCIEIDGVPALRAPRSPFAVMSDRIEAGTYLLAALITGGRLRLSNTPNHEMKAILDLVEKSGAELTLGENTIDVIAPERLRAVSADTAPYPGFPTDMQAQWMSTMCLSEGSCIISERIFENRFMHVAELVRLGADIRIHGSSAHVTGVSSMRGAAIMATDLRASASLVLAALAAKGVSEVLRIYHLDRGYESLVEKLVGVGADIKRVPSHVQVQP